MTLVEQLAVDRYQLPEKDHFIEYRGKGAWAVAFDGLCLNKDLEWEWEPRPSSRDEDFIARTRFPTPGDALAAWERLQEEEASCTSSA